MRVSSEGSWDLRIFEIMRVKVRENTCERARSESVVIKSACDAGRLLKSACERVWE